jgi:hypothetical protein
MMNVAIGLLLTRCFAQVKNNLLRKASQIRRLCAIGAVVPHCYAAEVSDIPQLRDHEIQMPVTKFFFNL